jgi:hypothetical protein
MDHQAVEWGGMDWSDLAAFCEGHNELTGLIKCGEFLD